jgi:hypothetical protein
MQPPGQRQKEDGNMEIRNWRARAERAEKVVMVAADWADAYYQHVHAETHNETNVECFVNAVIARQQDLLEALDAYEKGELK